jgi:hypothetical protein
MKWIIVRHAIGTLSAIWKVTNYYQESGHNT